jgi:hypothetical protein
MADFEAAQRADQAAISGYRSHTDHTAGRVVVDMQDRILLLQPTATPLLTITGRIKGKRVAKNRKFEWLEKDREPRTITFTAAETDVATTLDASAGDVAKLSAGDVLRVDRTGELILVGTPGTTDFTSTRGIGGAGVAFEVGDTARIIGTSFPDGSRMGDLKSITESEKYNYTQIFKTAFGFTGRDLATELYGGDDKPTETKWQGMRHKKDIEFSFIFGNRHVIAASGATKERTFTGGLEWAINTNRWNVSGVALNSRVFNEFLEEALRWGKGGRQQAGESIKYLFHSSRWGTEIHDWMDKKLEYAVLDKQIGFKVAKYVSPHGVVMLVPTPILDEFAPDRAYLLDLNHIDYVYLRGRDTKLLDDQEETDRDGEAFQFQSDCGIQVSDEASHSVLLGLS